MRKKQNQAKLEETGGRVLLSPPARFPTSARTRARARAPDAPSTMIISTFFAFGGAGAGGGIGGPGEGGGEGGGTRPGMAPEVQELPGFLSLSLNTARR